MTAGVATVLARLYALIAAISKESGFLEKMLSQQDKSPPFQPVATNYPGALCHKA
jgi:hypothetical protein